MTTPTPDELAKLKEKFDWTMQLEYIKHPTDIEAYVIALEQRIEFLEQYCKDADARTNLCTNQWLSVASKLQRIEDIINEGTEVKV